ncbi:MAG: histone deacetylase, partial [Omnitrophica bacterium GWA2_52_8]
MSQTGYLYDSRYLLHSAGEGHPERPARLEAIHDRIKTLPCFPELLPIAAAPALIDWVRTIHDAEYIERARQASSDRRRYLDSMDVGICEDSFDIALLAAGGALALADDLMAGKILNGFGVFRPPGHHAEKSQAMGFCLFNNIAILARYLKKHYGLEKIMILDWDVHHGNGTQHAFEEDPSVLFVSLHQYPFYPGTGAYSETGTGKGKGATLNCPMPAGCG